MSPVARNRLVGIALGIVLFGGGLFILGKPLYERLVAIQQTQQRGSADTAALNSWNDGGSNDLKGAVTGDSSAAHGVIGQCSPGASPPSDYALVSFSQPVQYSYMGVAGNGTWDLLNSRSMVHYQTTPDPGQQGNVIIAFHREPNYEHIDLLGVGGTISVQDRQCHVYTYTVTQTWTLSPSQVTQLNPTSGYNLTMITCTPFWVDNNRLVWRATLTAVDGKAFTA